MPPTPDQPIDPQTFRRGIDRCKRKRDDLVDAWATNVDYARGKPWEVESDQDRVYVNADNTMAKRKAAQIASACPEARLRPKRTARPEARAVMGAFGERLNEEIRTANVGASLFEVAKDAINAAGFGAVLVGYKARTRTTPALSVDPKTLAPEQQQYLDQASQQGEEQAQAALQQLGIQVVETPQVMSYEFYCTRLSPSDFLWPVEFERSDFNQAPWVGNSGRMTAAEAQNEFKLTPEQITEILAAASQRNSTLRDDDTPESTTHEERVEYDQIFYKRALYDPAETDLRAIWRIVFVAGRTEPVVHGRWEGQRVLEGAGLVGAQCYPIQVLTLDYLSDDALPPSDSAIARPQVHEMIRSRTQMVQQRERNHPVRWHDVNRVDPLTNVNLMNGVWQNSIPVKGDGSRVIGEVARANYPSENYEFERTIKNDLTEAWGMDANQLGMFSRGRRTKGEAQIVQANFATLTGFQRGRVGAFFCRIAEVFAGLISLHVKDLPPIPVAEGQPPIDLSQISGMFDYWILPDATVLLDAGQQGDALMELLDMVGKSGFVNPEPLIEQIILLKGQDPAKIMRKPEPPKEEPPAISYRFAGVQDLLNPVVMGMLIARGQAPTPEQLAAAFKLLSAAGVPLAPGVEPQGGVPGAGPLPPPELPPADARPEWTAMPTISKRTEDA